MSNLGKVTTLLSAEVDRLNKEIDGLDPASRKSCNLRRTLGFVLEAKVAVSRADHRLLLETTEAEDDKTMREVIARSNSTDPKQCLKSGEYLAYPDLKA